MPALTPFGGISLIVHAIINVVAFTYRSINSLFKRFKNASQKTAVIRSVRNNTLRPGVSFPRRVFAYSIIGLMFVLFIGSGMLILNLASKSDMTKFTVNAVNEITSKNSVFADVHHYEASSSLSDNPLPTISSFDTANTTATEYSIVDILSDAGFVDNSMGNRAFLAANLLVVNHPEEYIGTPEQNKNLIAAFEKIIRSNLTLNVETTTLSFNNSGKIN